jgi:predicted nuclease of predicted toxin-antitoxin system
VNLVADEGVDGPVVQRLRNDGHDVIYVAELSPGVTNDDVLRQANDRDALLVTADQDFGELVFRQRLVHSGVLLLRLAGLTNATKAGMWLRFSESVARSSAVPSASSRQGRSAFVGHHDDSHGSNFSFQRSASPPLNGPFGFARTVERHLMPPLGRYELALKALDGLKR